MPVHAEFAARIARIESGQGSSKRTLYVGVEDSFQIPERLLGKAPSPRRSGLAVVAALVIGALSVELSLLLQDQIVALIGPAPTAQLQLLQLICIGVLLAIIATRTLGLRARAHTLAMVLGAAIGACVVLVETAPAMAELQDLRSQVMPHALSLGEVKLQF